jgi:hypothetical protein
MEDESCDADLMKPDKKVVSFPKKSKRAAVPIPASVEDDSPPSADPHIVEYLSTLLERAKRGEIQAFGFAGVTQDFVAVHSFYAGEGDYRASLVAAVSFLSHNLVAECVSDAHTVSDCDPDDAPGGGS